MKLYYTGECRTNIVISIDVRHIFFMWSVFAIKHLMYRFVKPLSTISVGCLPIWVMAIECPQVMIMAYLLNKEWEIGLLIEQEMYNLLLENYAEYFLLSWMFTDMGIRWCVHRRLLHIVTMDIQAFVPLWHQFVSWHVPVHPNSTCVRRTRVKCGNCWITFSDIGEHWREMCVVCFLLGNSTASESYMSTFRNTLSVPSS
jgi:hypothetical protein